MNTAPATDSPPLQSSLSTHALRRWLAGSATIAGSLAAGSASAEMVQITLTGNEVLAEGLSLTNNTTDDLTGDGIADLTSTSFYFNPSGDAGINGRIGGQRVRARANFSTSFLSTSSFSTFTYFSVAVGSSSTSGGRPLSRKNFILIRFSDARINGGAETEGLIEVVAANLSASQHRIAMVRLIFDDADPQLPKVEIDETLPEWRDASATATTPIPASTIPSKIERKIAALERKIRQIKANGPQNAPRLNFYKLKTARLRQIAAYERQIAALKRKLANGGR